MTPTTPIASIEAACQQLADSREALTNHVTLLQAELAAIQARHLRPIRRAVSVAAERHAQLHALIEAHPAAFDKPKSQIFHGIKCGYRKGTGKLEIEDPDRTLALIKKLFPDQTETLIHTTEAPDKKALQELPAADIKRLGCTLEDTSDKPFIKPTDTAVDKTVKALLANAVEEAVA